MNGRPPAGLGSVGGAAAAPLDLLLTYAALGPSRRVLPGAAGVRFASALAHRPHRVARRATLLAGELARVGFGCSTLAVQTGDRRFTNPAWTSNPLLRRLVQAYPAAGRTAEELVAEADLEWRDAERLRVVVDNLVQALAPSNQPLTSPAFWKALIDSGGGSLVRGARHLAGDRATPPRMPTMVTADAFEVGADLAVTPGGGRAAHARLRAAPVPAADAQGAAGAAAGCAADDQQVLHPRPRPGSQPGRLSRRQRPAGLRRLLAQPRRPPPRLGRRHLRAGDPGGAGGDPADLPGRLVGAVGAVLGRDPGRHGARPSSRHRTTAPGRRVWPGGGGARPGPGGDGGRGARPWHSPCGRRGLRGEGVPGRPDPGRGVRLAASRRPDLALLGQQLPGRARATPLRHPLLECRHDQTHRGPAPRLHPAGRRQPPHPPRGGHHARLARRPGHGRHRRLPGRRRRDHLCPWQACYRSTQLLGGPTRFVLSSGGHIASMVNPPGNRNASFRTAPDNPPDPAHWLGRSTTEGGSWWPDFARWLEQRGGGEKARPRRLGAAGFPPLDAAPGTYVLDR